jgi:hypothetical protein
VRNSKSDIIRAWPCLIREFKRLAKADANMNAWYYFWVLNFAVAGSAFFFIAVIVTIRGVGDLREMFRRLHIAGQNQESGSDASPQKT